MVNNNSYVLLTYSRKDPLLACLCFFTRCSTLSAQDNSNGTKAQSRTFTDLLQTPYDEDVFEYYATSQLVQVHVRNGQHVLYLCVNLCCLACTLAVPWLYLGCTTSTCHEAPRLLAQVPSGTITPLSIPRMYTGVSASPDEQYLLVSWIERPFSFMVPCGRFPKRVQLWDR